MAVDTKQEASDIPKTKDAIFKSSPYKPSGLLLNLDFEDAEIKSFKHNKNTYDKLVFKTPEGKTTAVGIMYEGGNQSDRYAKMYGGRLL